MLKSFYPLVKIGLCTFGYLYAISNPILAQVTPDGTVNTQVNQNGNVAEITGGETRGSNLFHSFQDFSVGTGSEAFFNNANAISNIFSRVTGGRISDIDGTIRANGSASLFLINPAGIIFGNNAKLDIGGSFYGSSATSILFEDGEFSAADLENPPLLTISAPIGLSFRDNPGAITNLSSSLDFNGNPVGLQVDSGQFLTLLGGDINFTGGRLTAPGGRVELGAVASEGTVTINETVSLGFPENLVRGNVSFNNGSRILVSPLSSGDSGNINITARAIALDGISILEASNLGNGAAGSLDLNTGTLTISGGSQLSNTNVASGIGGSIVINATDTIEITGTTPDGLTASRIDASTSGSGAGGDIQVNAKNLIIRDGSAISSFAVIGSSGQGGNIAIDVDDSIRISGFRPLGFFRSSIDTQSGGTGNAGNISIDTSNLIISNGAEISTQTTGEGSGGRLDISATDSVTLSGFIPGTAFGSQISSQSLSIGAGDGAAGDIAITTPNLLIRDGARVTVNSFETRNGGSLLIDTESLTLDNFASIIALTFSQIGSNIALRVADILQLKNNSTIRAVNFGNSEGGNINTEGGNINIDARFIVAFPSQLPEIGNDIVALSIGGGGNIDIQVDRAFGIQPGISRPDNGSNDFDASSALDIEEGVIVNILDSIALQSVNLIDSEQTTAQACQANREAAAMNGLNITGKGGIPPEPGLPLNSLNVSINGETNPTSAIPEPIKTSQGKIQPARGIKVTESGEIILTAYRTNNSGDRIPEIKRNCG
ncbi:MAG: filamentous hemagglutinin N-terminal domain-containing protein [Pleurocapsa sp. MO_192.B19]|nr:filamentous hemagglutinin N-terminal domain-containing protein [Pleurocapsa sp. MO_192.B19]